jgi:biopolymer transport protein ExbD
VADVMFTARTAGYANFELLTSDGHALASITISVPRSWNSGPLWPPHQEIPSPPIVDLHPDSLEAVTREQAGDRANEASLGAFVERTKGLWPHETVVRLAVDRDVPLQRLVTVLDTLRGEHCKLQRAMKGEEVPTECMFWQPIVNTSPPLFWAIDRLDDFGLGDATASREGSGGPSPKRLLAAYEAHRTEIRDCLAKLPHFMEHARDRDVLGVDLGRSGDGETAAIVRLRGGPVRADARDCVLKPLGVEASNTRPLEQQVYLGIEVTFRGVPGPTAK